MKKTILSIFMAVVVCIMTVMCVYAHVVVQESVLSVTGACDCNASTTSSCGGNSVGSTSKKCPYNSSCSIVTTYYQTSITCRECRESWFGEPHTHIDHTICSYYAGCPYDSAIASIDDMEG